MAGFSQKDLSGPCFLTSVCTSSLPVALLFLSLPAAVLISPIEVLGQFYHFDENNF